MRYLACSLAIASGFSVPIMLYFYLLQKYGKHNTHKRQLPKFLPKRLILLRHGQSEGNIDPHIYQAMPDNALHLTCMGKEQVRAAGKVISRIVGHDSVRFIISPYVRTIESYKEIVGAWQFGDATRFQCSEEPRIREMDFGNFQDPAVIEDCKGQRERFGQFFYRFPSGESPADVYDRISSFLESLHRLFRKSTEQNYILIAHGVTIRVLLMRYFRFSIRDFEKLDNFDNAEFVVLEKNKDGYFEVANVFRPMYNRSGQDIQMQEYQTLRLRTFGSVCMSPLSNVQDFQKQW